MAQYDFGTINTATTTGGDLATLLQNWRDAVLSNHSGTTRPAYIKPGQLWVNTTTAASWVVNLYDGVTDIPLGYVNTTDDTAGFLSRTLVTTKTASATIALNERDMVVGITASTANLTMTLPAATTAKNGFKITLQKRDNTAFTITITRSGSDLINGGTSYVLSQQYDTVEAVCDGSANWYAYGGVLDLSINTAKLADGAVTASKIAANAVSAAKLDATVNAMLVPSGAVVPFAGSTVPTGWILCFGQAISRTAFAALFEAIGTTYGSGDGSTTFNLPDLRGRVAAGNDIMGGVSANRLTGTTMGGFLGAAGGAETHTLTEAQMPLHGHPFRLTIQSASTASSTTSGGLMMGNSGLQNFAAHTGAPASTQGQQIGGSGGNQAHLNVQPTIVLNYIIKI